jgi:hypothetical protein
MSENNKKRIKPVIIGIAVTALFGIIVLLLGNEIRKDTFGNKTATTFYFDSIKNKIKTLEFQHRSYHLILDDDREYYFTIDQVNGILNYKDPLYNFVEKGDSIFKDEKCRTFHIKKKSLDFIEVTFFK